jgi:hypothetical protein
MVYFSGYWWLLPLLGLLVMAGMMFLCMRRMRTRCCHMAGHSLKRQGPVTFSSAHPSVRDERP